MSCAPGKVWYDDCLVVVVVVATAIDWLVGWVLYGWFRRRKKRDVNVVRDRNWWRRRRRRKNNNDRKRKPLRSVSAHLPHYLLLFRQRFDAVHWARDSKTLLIRSPIWTWSQDLSAANCNTANERVTLEKSEGYKNVILGTFIHWHSLLTVLFDMQVASSCLCFIVTSDVGRTFFKFISHNPQEEQEEEYHGVVMELLLLGDAAKNENIVFGHVSTEC